MCLPGSRPRLAAHLPPHSLYRPLYRSCTAPCTADPTEYFERFPQASILASSDDLSPSNPPGDDGLEQLDSIHSAMNIGARVGRYSAAVHGCLVGLRGLREG